MKQLKIKNSTLEVSNIILGCMRINSLSLKEIDILVKTAMEQGINMFDHADIYGHSECEELFSKAIGMNSDLRQKMIIQSKCGISDGYYDFSKEHIISSVEGSLKRLDTDYLDVLLLHRPDLLMDPQETAEALCQLFDSGKVRYFGVSNQNPMQIQLLAKYFPHKILFNQLQMSIAHTALIDNNVTNNMIVKQSIDRTEGTFDFCRLNDITIQAWSPFQRGFFEGVFIGDNENYPKLNKLLEVYAEKYNVTPSAIAVAWLTTHPANIQVVLGTTKHSRIIECCKGSEIKLTRSEWYELYKSAGNIIP